MGNFAETADDIDRRLRPFWVQWISKLPAEQQSVLADYKSKNYPLFAIAQDPGRTFTDDEQARFDALDAALDAAPPLSSSISAWRGFTRYDNLAFGPNTWRPPAVGSVETFPSWTSVSMIEQVGAGEAYLLQDKGDHEYSVLMEIELPVGQKCIYIEAARPHCSHEAELLLPRATTYEVLSFEPLERLRTLPPPREPYQGHLMRVQVLLALETSQWSSDPRPSV